MENTIEREIATASSALEHALDAYQVAAFSHATWREREMEHEDHRALAKRDAIWRLMHTNNQLTDKAHSASSAEAVVATDPEYAEYLAAGRAATVEVITSRAAMESARLRALALASRSLEPTP